MTPRAWRLALVCLAAVLLVPFGYLLAMRLGVPRGWQLVVALASGGTLAFVASLVFERAWKWVTSSVSMGLFFTHNNAEKFVVLSHVESMIAAGNGTAATEEIDRLLALHGLDERLSKLAVEFHLGTLGDAARAEQLLRRMRADEPATFERYATQRLIDLYMSNPATYPKALTELRRMTARFPGTRDANGAEACIVRLRHEMEARSTV